MTKKMEDKIRKLIKVTDDNLPRTRDALRNRTSNRSPLTESAAKYYPALKKLAKE